MSNKQNEDWLLRMKEEITAAMAQGDFPYAETLSNQMRQQGFTEEAVQIWDELEKEDRQLYLDYCDSK